MTSIVSPPTCAAFSVTSIVIVAVAVEHDRQLHGLEPVRADLERVAAGAAASTVNTPSSPEAAISLPIVIVAPPTGACEALSTTVPRSVSACATAQSTSSATTTFKV